MPPAGEQGRIDDRGSAAAVVGAATIGVGQGVVSAIERREALRRIGRVLDQQKFAQHTEGRLDHLGTGGVVNLEDRVGILVHDLALIQVIPLPTSTDSAGSRV